MAKDNGGPAFPVQEPVETFVEEFGRYQTTYLPTGGMSLRDYFAGQALAALKPQLTGETETDVRAIAQYAYRIADAMIAER